ncbi:hypothetical protein ACFFV7_39685 [Nonomuraea spiralis]|uniref:Uncharacterized protein n=1 Tax=Nonomuraea spiralis TaxID=46182 RepID=A0ABV5IS35_9ACTN|nr:hypothetical protein [Nonomuraea spiralis]GGT44995.1 hypothetical protein GCM10010176_105430 [Nonomuraea spiralis]
MVMRLTGEVLPALTEQAGPPAGGPDGNDYVTCIFAPPDAAEAADTFEAEVLAIAPAMVADRPRRCTRGEALGWRRLEPATEQRFPRPRLTRGRAPLN